MVKKTLIFALATLFLISLVMATDTTITIKTLPDHKVSIFVYGAGELALTDSKHGTSDSQGMFSYVHSSDKSRIDVLVKITKDAQTVFKEKFEDYEAGKPISIRMDNEEITGEYNPAAKGPENVTNETAIQTSPEVEITEVKTEEESNSEGVTGSTISGIAGLKISTIVYYILGVFFVLVVIFFIMKRSWKYRSTKSYGNIGPSVPPSTLSASSTSDEDNLASLERKIAEAQSELNLMRNQEKIKVAEARLEADKRELERLRQGQV